MVSNAAERSNRVSATAFPESTDVEISFYIFSKAALNTLEIFGNFLGLKMNTDKTQIVWIDKKRACKDKLEVTQKVSFGATRGSLNW